MKLSGLALSGARRDGLPLWRETVLEALRKSRTLDEVADQLEVSRRTLNRWLALEPGLKSSLGASLALERGTL
jgi:hypothetical protein